LSVDKVHNLSDINLALPSRRRAALQPVTPGLTEFNQFEYAMLYCKNAGLQWVRPRVGGIELLRVKA